MKKFITYNNETLSINDWSKKLGIPRKTIFGRLKKKLPLEKVFSQLKLDKKYVEYKETKFPLKELALKIKINQSKLYSELRKGKNLEEIELATILSSVKIKKEINHYLNIHKPIEYKGESHLLKEWAKILNINYKTLHGRYSRGEEGDKLFCLIK